MPRPGRQAAGQIATIRAVPETFDALCASDEKLLFDSAERELADAALLDQAGDELFRLAQAAKAAGAPADAPDGWSASSNGVLAAAAMALRTGRAIRLLVRSGYGVEAAGLVRRLGEITQRAAGCAEDSTGRYARTWGEGGGATEKPAKAYVRGVADSTATRDKWGFLSQMEHANLRPYLNLMCSTDERGDIVHPVAPARHEAADALVLSSAAWDLVRAAAAVCKAHSHVDEGPTLQLAKQLQSRHAASDARVDAWVSAREREMPGGDSQ